MYFPVGWAKQLNAAQPTGDARPLVHICSNQDRLLFAVLTHSSISIWYCKPAVQIVCFRRSDNSVVEFGMNVCAKWKPDSSMIAIVTSKGYILFYQVEVELSKKNASLYIQKEERSFGGKQDSIELNNSDCIPALKLSQVAYSQVPGGVTSLVCLREELMVATRRGLLQRIHWDGIVNSDMTIELSSIPFSADLQHSRASMLDDRGIYVSRQDYSPLLGGFAVVLSNGRAAFITANTLKFEPSNIVGVWAQEVTEATTAAINHKYTLMAFGCQNAEGIVYHLDELTGALLVSHRLVVSSKEFPDAQTICGAVSELKWTPDGTALAMVWRKGGFSLWSVFGALLVHSMGVESGGSISDDLNTQLLRIQSLEWGCEGYHLWLLTDRPDNPSPSPPGKPSADPHPALHQLNFVKSALALNPCAGNHEHLFLQGEDKLYLNPEEGMPHLHKSSALPDSLAAAAAFIGNKQWQIVPLPHTYLAHNWPIRFAAVNAAGHCVAIAGKTGLAHYALYSRKWKLFGNETQERDMIVTGGLIWWKDFVCTACYNLLDQRDEIRFYPRDSKLDNTFAHIVRVPSQIMLINTFRDLLIVLCADCHIMIYSILRVNVQPNPTVQVSKIQEVAIGNFIPHPANVVALTLTSIRTDTGPASAPSDIPDAESIVVNVAGRLLLFQRDRSGPQLKSPKEAKDRPLPFCSPVMVASAVESMWLCNHRNGRKQHLTEALWLCCGAAGVKVWLPLYPKEEQQNKKRGFMSKRIMIPFHVDIYPLALLFEAGIMLGASSESLSYNASNDEIWPYLQLERTSHVYLHHILRQLLKRHLGVHALEIARTCTDLPYFLHVLELLLHEVLEEEATSKEPIPDPLLPRVVAFVEEFDFLQTVAHCARKSEVALWQYLFSIVGTPKDLFEECLLEGKLETAASYLIILQNLEQPIVARQHATLLLDAALEHRHWDLARDLVRFLGAIDPSEAECPHNVVKNRLASAPAMYPTGFPSAPPVSPQGNDGTFVRPNAARSRSLSNAETSSKEKSKLIRTDSMENKLRLRRSSSGHKDEVSADHFFIDVILNRHARKLLGVYRIRDLACFAANLEDYQLVGWLRKEQVRAARVEDFVAALKRLHEDFLWPMPVLTLGALQRISSTTSLSCQTARLVDQMEDLNGDGVCKGPGMGRPLGLTRTSTMESSLSTSDVQLRPPSSFEDVSHTTTEVSDTSSFMEGDSADSSSISDSNCLSELEQLSHELANRGPHQSEVELRYLFQIVLEAGCLEWALLIALVLRDAMAIVRTVNTASLTHTPIDMVGRMREGLSYLELWANTEWYLICSVIQPLILRFLCSFGYKPFMQAIAGQVKQLEKIVESNPPSRMQLTSSGTPSPRQRTVSMSSDASALEEEADCPERQLSMERDVTPLADDLAEQGEDDTDGSAAVDNLVRESSSYECAIS
ncbi:hypothetical protein CAPTEDRAFT_227272 [Capitella teleta]|uniref:Protein RIC1 homolog n=1 Tax=Capitella teleta TaxID=283909 RepID=R7TQG5_CAPTE|nr:hypothetical protein CAPTEDRAFT_227272 [Capitella teleta]|eukprot:ELT93270.1 hypothetical protein CAPTEDRAFT_227272 [Capitella teleta]